MKKGETLTSITEKYGVDVDDLKATNKIKGNKINARAKLKIVKEGSQGLGSVSRFRLNVRKIPDVISVIRDYYL